LKYEDRHHCNSSCLMCRRCWLLCTSSGETQHGNST
jgi:hypothetical protein